MASVALKKPDLTPLAGRVAESIFDTLKNLATLNGIGKLSNSDVEFLESQLNRLVLMERAANVLDAINNPQGAEAQAIMDAARTLRRD